SRSRSFSFYCYGDPSDLHSFPTRRSSDLLRVRIDVTAPAAPEISSPTHPAAPRRMRGRDVTFEWTEPKDVSGIKHYSYQLSRRRDRKSTRLNSSHVEISYAVFCLKKKNKI